MQFGILKTLKSLNNSKIKYVSELFLPGLFYKHLLVLVIVNILIVSFLNKMSEQLPIDKQIDQSEREYYVVVLWLMKNMCIIT